MIITKDNWLVVAIKAYENPVMDIEEINEDLKLFSLLLRSLRKAKTQNIQEKHIKLLLNRVITILNLFGNLAPRLILAYIPDEFHADINAVFKYLNYYQVYPETKTEKINEEFYQKIIDYIG